MIEILIGTQIGLMIANYGYAFFTKEKNWKEANEHSFFQLMALIAVYVAYIYVENF